MASGAGGAHIAPAFSLTDIMTVLCYKVLNFRPGNQHSPGRDRVVISKGHSCTVLYAILADRGFFSKKELQKFCQKGGILGGHPRLHEIPGVEATTGSLGHGFSFACGVAFAGKIRHEKYKVYAIVGDGECQEGTIWEAAMFAGNHALDNLIAIVDYNKLQGMGKIAEINGLEPLKDKWESFGWSVREMNGHDLREIWKNLSSAPFQRNKPSLIIAHTTKGCGISFMEGKAIWHYRLPNEEEMLQACQELKIKDLKKVLS